jgi:hypothetical protein
LHAVIDQKLCDKEAAYAEKHTNAGFPASPDVDANCWIVEQPAEFCGTESKPHVGMGKKHK